MIKLIDILNEGPRIGELPVRTYKLVQGKEAELDKIKIKYPKIASAIEYIRKNPDNITMKNIDFQYLNALKKAGILVSKDDTTSKPMSSDDVDDLFKEATFTSKYDDSPKLKGKQTKLPDELQAKLVKEGDDHEVAMAQNSLKSIIKSAIELHAKLGNMERDIPGWIQDHITNAENYIDQAAQGFHELKHDEMNEQLKRLQELANIINENKTLKEVPEGELGTLMDPSAKWVGKKLTIIPGAFTKKHPEYEGAEAIFLFYDNREKLVNVVFTKDGKRGNLYTNELQID